MPLLHTGSVSIYYRLYSAPLWHEGTPAFREDPRPKVLLLMGFAASHQAWAPQLADLLAAPVANGSTAGGGGAGSGPPSGGAAAGSQQDQQQDGEQQEGQQQSPMVVCVLDNRGVGRSTAPTERRDYSTEAMAMDALQVLDHLGWSQVHLVGHSMGSMIACKLAAAAPQRCASLSILSATGGGWQAIPKTWRALWLGLKLIFTRDPVERARVDVAFHFSPSLLAERDPATGETREQQLVAEYVAAAKATSGSPPQTPHGMRGQLAAVVGHRVRRREVRAIQSGAFPILVLHGREDVIALPRFGRRLARRLGAPCLELPGGHFVMREQAAAVNALLRSFILGRSFLNVERYPFQPFHYWIDAVAKQRAASRQLPLEAAPLPPAERERLEAMLAGRRLSSVLGEGEEAGRRSPLGGSSPGGSSVQLVSLPPAL